MSVAPIKVGETDKTLQGVAYVVAGGLITGVKTDLVVADIDSLYVIRDQSTAVTISSDGTGLTNKTNQNDAHSDGAVWNPGDGTLFVDVPDAAVAVYAKDVQLKGAWTDGSDSGVIRGTPVSLTSGFDWSTFGATILNRIGAFTGSGVNTILGFFKAIMFSDATEPSDAGDTFAASLEEVKAAADGGVAGGSTTTISLGVASMRWWITTDSAGNNVIASGTTQEAGTAQALLINGNTYYMWARKIGYNDLIAYSFVAVAD